MGEAAAGARPRQRAAGVRRVERRRRRRRQRKPAELRGGRHQSDWTRRRSDPGAHAAGAARRHQQRDQADSGTPIAAIDCT